ncbi:hypothetical protein NDU88_003008 [Pleurodeles waltl]|uniref:Uncharacterized protein n=1 Tax=Pleurodeles waltl TaxID=8319 RepID=A0AAV7VG47_PLEWA|nr:hypothetical protein NDU88_003008 [Pleurodeles waltl]
MGVLRGHENSPPGAQRRSQDAMRAGLPPGSTLDQELRRNPHKTKQPGREPGATASGPTRARRRRGQPSVPGAERALLGTKFLPTPPLTDTPISSPLFRW